MSNARMNVTVTKEGERGKQSIPLYCTQLSCRDAGQGDSQSFFDTLDKITNIIFVTTSLSYLMLQHQRYR